MRICFKADPSQMPASSILSTSTKHGQPKTLFAFQSVISLFRLINHHSISVCGCKELLEVQNDGSFFLAFTSNRFVVKLLVIASAGLA